jgi:Ser/Thr protein kinase RdoA (MazF antagonist)
MTSHDATKPGADLNHTAPYHDLTPEVILDAVDSQGESQGRRCSGSLLALNSYENRVYQVGLEAGGFLIAKFYRPGRWPDATILEEHAFSRELAEQEIPVVAPLANPAGETLHHFRAHRFALFPRQGGRPPELDDPEHLRWLGRFLGRIHAVGASGRFEHRPCLGIERFGEEPLAFVLEQGFVPAELAHNYRLAGETLLTLIRDRFEALGPLRQLRLHGDCHPGNILWTDAGPHFVDLDDCLTGPAIQDLWMLLSGGADDMGRQLRTLLEGYTTFFDFDPVEVALIEPLRALRLLHYSGWLARRWHDPAFPQAFPWFNTPRYWEDQLNTLREQAERITAPTLRL